MTTRRWRVVGDEGDLAAIVAKAAPGDDAAIADGRVFVGRTRATDPRARPAPGDEVVVHAARRGDASEIRILAEEGGIVAAYKPAELATIPDHRGARGTLLDEVARRVGCAPSDLHPTSRLDVGVSGIVLFARAADARDRLARARTEGRYRRLYVAIATRAPSEADVVWSFPIGRARDPRLRAAFGRDATEAETRARTIATATRGEALLALAPKTGRTHQLRVHASAAGLPLLGDAAYGGATRIVLPSGAVRRIERIALHAMRVVVPDARGRELRIEAPPPDDFRRIWEWLDGSADVWDTLVALP